MIRFILMLIGAYLVFVLVRRLLLPPRKDRTGQSKANPKDKRNEDVQKKMGDKIEDADFEDLD